MYKKILLNIFLLVFLINAISSECVFSECDCSSQESGYEVNCDIAVVQQMLPIRNPKSQIKEIVLLEFNNQEYERIPANYLFNLSVRSIEFKGNKIVNVDALAFNGVSDTDSIDLSQNQIEKLDVSVFVPIAASLKELKLSKNLLGNADVVELSNALNNAKNLNSLSLNDNKLRLMVNLRENDKLQQLELRYNAIESLNNADDLNSLLPASLTMLDMEFNLLQIIEVNYFSNLKNLKVLNLKYNRIHSVADGAFLSLMSLEKLALGRNELKQVPHNFLSNLNNLQAIDLTEQNANFVRIQNYAFDSASDNMEKLILDLSKNNIDSLDKRAFCKRSNKQLALTSLNLNGNPLSELDPCVFGNLAGLKIKVSLDSANLKCDCRVQYIASKVDLVGKCFNSNNLLVSMSNFECDDQVEVENMCKLNTNDYDCEAQPTTTASTPESTPSSTASVLPPSAADNNNNKQPDKSAILSTIAPITPQPVQKITSSAVCVLGFNNYIFSLLFLSFYTIIRKFLF